MSLKWSPVFALCLALLGCGKPQPVNSPCTNGAALTTGETVIGTGIVEPKKQKKSKGGSSIQYGGSTNSETDLTGEVPWQGSSGTVTSLSVPMPSSSCDSISASYGGGWQPIASAPRDGTAIEVLETYGVAPWYARYKWMKKGTKYMETVMFSDGNGKQTDETMEMTEPVGRWVDTSDQHKGLSEDNCAFWRPVAQTGEYVDPTGGAQNSVKYWCDSMHIAYDKKTDSCRP
jgi:hypothetical protein